MNVNKYNANVKNLVQEHIDSLKSLKKEYGLQFTGEEKLRLLLRIIKQAKTSRTYFS